MDFVWIWHNVKPYNKGDFWRSFIYNGYILHLVQSRDGDIWELE